MLLLKVGYFSIAQSFISNLTKLKWQCLRIQTNYHITEHKTYNSNEDKQPGQEIFLFEKQKYAKANKKSSKYKKLDNHEVLMF